MRRNSMKPQRLEDLPEEEQKKIALNLQLTTHRETDELPSPEELELVAKLRSRFPEELERRKANGTDWAPLFGDLFLTRVLRGCDGQIELATTWFTRYLENFEKFDVDALYLEMSSELDKHPDVPYGSAFMLPNAKDLKPYLNEYFHFTKPNAHGDLINYFAFCDVNMPGIAEAGLLSKFARYHQGATLLRVIVLDRESRRQGRMVKTIWLADLAGTSAAMFRQKKTQEEEDYNTRVSQFNESMAAEIMRKMYFLNGPWWAVMIWKVFQRYIPERFKAKVGVLDGTGLDDAEFVALMGGQAALQQMLLSRVGLISGQISKPSGEVYISAQSFFEYSISVTPGQMVNWTTEVLNGSGDFMMGASNITQSVLAKWSYSEEEVEEKMERFAGQALGDELFLEEVVPEVELDPGRGRVPGSYTVPREGVLILRWSNEHSMVRGKSIKYTTKVLEAEQEEDAIGHELGATLVSEVSDVGVGMLRIASENVSQKAEEQFLRHANDGVAAPKRGPGVSGQLVDKPSEHINIRAGAFFEESMTVVPGQTIRWTFEVLKGRADHMMGTPDIAFKVYASWFFKDGEQRQLPLHIAPEGPTSTTMEVRISTSEGAVCGSLEVPRADSGEFFEVVLRWSNEHSRLRSKSVKYALYALAADDEATSFAPGCWFTPRR